MSPAEADSQVWLAPEQFPLGQPGLAVPFRSIGRDFGHFFGSQANLKLLALFGGAALAGHQWDDDEGLRGTHMADRPFTAGNIGGGTAAQAGLAVGTWVIGRATGSPRMSAVGADLIEAQVVAQTVIQGLKYTVQRERPDGSNNRSFPSGHTGSAFATATVLQRHFRLEARRAGVCLRRLRRRGAHRHRQASPERRAAGRRDRPRRRALGHHGHRRASLRRRRHAHHRPRRRGDLHAPVRAVLPLSGG